MKTVALIFVFAAILLLSHVSSVAQQVAYQSPAGTKFLLYTPASYANPGNHPMLISLHGVDEIGDDITKLTNGGPLAPSRLIATNKWPASRPLLVLSPLLSSTVVGPDPEWPANYIDEVVQYVVANYRVDPNRSYITG
jgi:predicted peptidase